MHEVDKRVLQIQRSKKANSFSKEAEENNKNEGSTRNEEDNKIRKDHMKYFWI